MSYPHPQPFHPAPAPAPGGLRGWFKNASGGLLAFLSVITVIVCCVTPIVFCLFGGVFDASTYVDETPTVEITNCDIKNDDKYGLNGATVEFSIKHDGAYSRSLTVEVEIRDSQGVAVGTGRDSVFGLEPSVTEHGKARVYSLTGPGATCHVTSVS